MSDISKKPPKYHELCRALDCLPVRGCEKDRDIPGISSTEKNVLLALAFYYGLGAGVFPSMKVLARKISVGCPRTARNTLRSLEQKGYIWHEECYTRDEEGKKRQTTNSWYFSDAVFLNASLVKEIQEIQKLRQEGVTGKELYRAEEQAEGTRKKLLQSLTETREKSPGMSVRHGRLGNCLGRMKIYHNKIISLEERLLKTEKPEEVREIRQLITTRQILLKKVEREHQNLLKSPRENYTPPRLVVCGERKKIAGKPDHKPKPEPEYTPEPGLSPAPDSLSVPVPLPVPDPEPQSEIEPCQETQKENPVSDSNPVSVPEPSSEPEKTNHDYQEFYLYWKEAGGPTIPKADRVKFEATGIDPKEAIKAAKCLLQSPYLRARFRSVLWLPHIHKEELFEYRARVRVGRRIAELMEQRGLSLEESLKQNGLTYCLPTYHGKVVMKLNRELLIEWIKPWTEPVLEDQRKMREEKPVSTPPPPFNDPFEDIPF